MDSSLSFDPGSPDQQMAGGKTSPVSGHLSFSAELATTGAELMDRGLKSSRPEMMTNGYGGCARMYPAQICDAFNMLGRNDPSRNHHAKQFSASQSQLPNE